MYGRRRAYGRDRPGEEEFLRTLGDLSDELQRVNRRLERGDRSAPGRSASKTEPETDLAETLAALRDESVRLNDQLEETDRE